MSRPVAHNRVSEPINGSIVNGDDVGNIVYTVDGAGNNYYDGYADRLWVPSAEGAAPIVFVTDTFTQGYTGDPQEAVPIFFACAGTSSAAIIYTANRLPGMEGQDFGSVGEALEYITRNGYFILEGNDPFQGDFQNGNLLTLDASKMSSYPQTGTTFYDLSGNAFSFDLINGPSFNSNGWFSMDGADDSIGLAGNTTLKTTNTLVMWLRTTDTTGLLLTGNPPGTTGGQYVAAYYPGQGFYSGAAGSPDYFMDTLATANPATPINYLDGRFHMWEVRGLNFGGWTNDWYFLSYAAGYQIAGDVAKIKMFNSYLTTAQSKQLYFGSPIVTDGLVFAVDANNIVSYPKSGTAWYNLTGSVASASLFNSPIFTLPNGGAIDFDGTDDFATTPSTTISGDQTLCAWGVAEGPPNSPAGVITQHDYASTANFGINYVQNSGYRFGASIGYTNGTREFDSKVTNYTVQEGVIWNVVLVYSSSNNTIYWYVNGQLDSTYALSATPKSTNWPIGLGRWDPSYPAYYFTGKIFNSKIYNRALSAAEIQQNYQAEQYRFAGPQGIVTNGLVYYLDAANLDSYPGSGTTSYSLVGSNNGTLNNGIGWTNAINGGAFILDGTDDYIELATPANLPVGTSDRTIITFVKTPSTFSEPFLHVFHYGTPTQDQAFGLAIYRNSATVGYLATHPWVGTPYAPSPTLDPSTTYCLAVGYQHSNTTHYFWINGTPAAGTANVRSINTGTTTARVGSRISTPIEDWGPNGEIYVTLVYNRLLTDAEITQVYSSQKAKYGL